MATNEESTGPERDDEASEGGDQRHAERRGGGTEHGADRVDAGGPYLDEGGYDVGHGREDPGNPLWDESLVVLLVVGGLALLLFPEPGTSAVGVLMIVAGVIAWLVDAIG